MLWLLPMLFSLLSLLSMVLVLSFRTNPAETRNCSFYVQSNLPQFSAGTTHVVVTHNLLQRPLSHTLVIVVFKVTTKTKGSLPQTFWSMRWHNIICHTSTKKSDFKIRSRSDCGNMHMHAEGQPTQKWVTFRMSCKRDEITPNGKKKIPRNSWEESNRSFVV